MRLLSSVLLLMAIPAAAQTTLNIPGTIAVSNLPAIGVNMGGESNDGTNLYTNNLLYSQGGNMPGAYHRTNLYCNAGGTNDTTHWYNASNNSSSTGFGVNYFVGATYEAVTSTGVVLGTGTITASTSNNGAGIQLTLGTALSTTCSSANQDVLIIRQDGNDSNFTPTLLYGNNTSTSICSGATWLMGDTSPSSTNTLQSLQMPTGCQWKGFYDGAGPNTNTNPTIAASRVPWINMNGTYIASYKAKCLTAGCSTVFAVGRLTGTTYVNSIAASPTFNVTPGAGWQTFSYTFTATENGSQPPNVQVTLNCNGTCAVQDIQVVEQSQISANTTILRDISFQWLVDHKWGSIRFMSGADWCSSVADETGPIGNNRWCGFGTFGPYNAGLHPPISYADELHICNAVGTQICWITVGAYNLPAELAALATWTSTNTDALAIKAAGHQVHYELGNEAWNTGVQGSIFSGTGTAYGALAGAKIHAFKTATGYDASYMKIAADGWTVSGVGSGSWAHNTLTAAAISGSLPDYIDNEAYMLNGIATVTLSGSDVSTTGAPWPDMFAENANFNTATAPISPSTSFRNNQAYLAANFPTVGSAVYEGQCDPLRGTALTQTQMDEVGGGSVGCALETIENYLLLQRDSGYTGPLNIFTAPQDHTGYTCISGAACPSTTVGPSWGIMRLTANGPAQAMTYYDRPTGILAGLWNNARLNTPNLANATQSCTGGLGTCYYAYAGGQNVGFGNSIAANPQVNYTENIVYKDSSNGYTVYISNRDLVNTHTVTFTGSGAPSGTITRTVFPGSGKTIILHNENTYLAPTITAPLVVSPTPTSVTGVTITVPAASAVILRYTAGSTPTAATPTLSPAAGTYTSAQTVTITTSTASPTIYYTTDGSTPTTGSTVYSGPITVSTSQTIKAIATASGFTQSAVGSAAYVIGSAPVSAGCKVFVTLTNGVATVSCPTPGTVSVTCP